MERSPVGRQKGYGETRVLGEAELEVVFFPSFRFLLKASTQESKMYRLLVCGGDFGEEGIAGNVRVHFCKIQLFTFGKIDGLLVDLTSTYHEDVFDPSL